MKDDIDLKGIDLVADALSDFRMIQILNAIHRRERKIQQKLFEIENTVSSKSSSGLIGTVGVIAGLFSVALAIKNVTLGWIFLIIGIAVLIVIAIIYVYFNLWEASKRKKAKIYDKIHLLNDSLSEYGTEINMLEESFEKLKKYHKDKKISDDLFKKKEIEVLRVKANLDKEISECKQKKSSLEKLE